METTTNKNVIQHILDSNFLTVEITGRGTATFKKKVENKTYYLCLNKDRKMKVMDNKSNIMFDGYPETKEEFDLMIKMIRI